MPLLHTVARAVWRRIGGRWQWRVLRWRQTTFLVGLTGIVRDDAGRVLVQRHRYWMGDPWGLPSGWAEAGETWEQGLAREVHEETGLHLAEAHVLRARPFTWETNGPRIEVVLVGRVDGSPTPVPDGTEVLEAAFLTVDEARARLRTEHVWLLDLAVKS